MDIKSIVRVFRFGELHSRAERDPTQKRPPTIMFLGAALTLGLVALAIGVIATQAGQADEPAGSILQDEDSITPTNATSTVPSQEPPPPDTRPTAGHPILARD